MFYKKVGLFDLGAKRSKQGVPNVLMKYNILKSRWMPNPSSMQSFSSNNKTSDYLKKKTQNTDTTYVELLIHYSWTHLHNLVISFSYLEKIKQTNKNHKPMFLSSQSL